MQQRTDEWFMARIANVTASRVSDVLAVGRSGAESASRSGYMSELITEHLTGVKFDGFKGNSDTERGVELEPVAIAQYEIQTGLVVCPVGFIKHPRIARSGASPDGLVGDSGLIEVKAPRPHIHLDYLLNNVPPKKYMPQMAMQAACCERQFVDFVSYCPVMPPDLQLFIVRYTPTLAYLQEVEAAVVEFLAELDEKLVRIATRRVATAPSPQITELEPTMDLNLPAIDETAAPADAPPLAPASSTEAPEASVLATLKLGEINARLSPVSITADGLRQIGFEPVGKERAAVLYRESDLAGICAALIEHIQKVAA